MEGPKRLLQGANEIANQSLWKLCSMTEEQPPEANVYEDQSLVVVVPTFLWSRNSRFCLV